MVITYPTSVLIPVMFLQLQHIVMLNRINFSNPGQKNWKRTEVVSFVWGNTISSRPTDVPGKMKRVTSFQLHWCFTNRTNKKKLNVLPRVKAQWDSCWMLISPHLLFLTAQLRWAHIRHWQNWDGVECKCGNEGMDEDSARSDPVTNRDLQHGFDQFNALIPLVWVGLVPLAHT